MKKIFLFVLGIFSAGSLVLFLLSYFSYNVSLENEISHIQEFESALAEEVVPSVSPSIIIPQLQLSTIFTLHRTAIFGDESVRLLMTGDIIPARVTDDRIRKKGVDYPFSKLNGVLQDADITVTNLEAPLLSNCPPHLEGMKFCGSASFAQAMKRVGIDVVGIENNHIGNHGLQGIEETRKHLSDASLDYVSFKEPLYTKIKDTTFGFIALNVVGKAADREALAAIISDVQGTADVTVVMPHWGKEYTSNPERAAGIAPDDPISLGHFMIDSGADLVLGNHPHWVQGVEKYKEGFIAYAHGNFIFDQEWSQETKEGVIGQYIFTRGTLVDVSFQPIIIEDYAVPRLATDEEAVRILDRMKKSSDLLI